MRIQLLTLAFIVVAFTNLSLVAAPPGKVGEIKTEKRSFKTKSGEVIQYELGTLFVRENRGDPQSRVIGVGFARFPSKAQPPAAPPVFRLPGGPGGSYLTRLKSRSRRQREWMFADIARLQAFCDVVLVDQRGFSERGDVLYATFSSSSRPRTVEAKVSVFKAFARETVAEFAEGEVDLRGYTVKECAHDVAELGKALGYDKITLNGTSFGSQWSFAVMRLHPEIVARALLSGVEPLNHGYDMPSYVFAAVQRMWLTLDEDPRFKPYLPKGGMAEAARVVIERLERERLKVAVGTIGPEDFPWNNPTQILELYHGQTARWSLSGVAGLVPQRGRMPLIAPLIDSSLGVTPERRHRLWTDPATRYMGRGNFALYLATAEIWPSPDVGDDFRTPVLSKIPVVFAQGDWDTKTPVENTYEIAPYFLNSRVVIATRGGHGVLESITAQLPKVGKQFDEFLRTADMEGIPARVELRPSRRFAPPTFPPPSP